MMTQRPLAVLSGLVVLWVAIACLDTTSPVTGIASISTVIMPTPSIVQQDTMRDTLGQITKLSVVAFAPNGDTVKDVQVQFVAIDQTNQLHVHADGLAYGDTLSPAASVVAQVTPAKGKGLLQTAQVLLPIVPKPDSAIRGPDTTFFFSFPSSPTDTLSSSLLSAPLTVTVLAGGDTVVPYYVVSYKVERSPASNDSSPTVVIYDKSGLDSTIAITSPQGVASRQLRLRLNAVTDRQALDAGSDTVIVTVRVLYHGQPLQMNRGSTFIIPIKLSITG